MNYFSKPQAETIRNMFQHLIGRPCVFNNNNEQAVLQEIIVEPSGVLIKADGQIQLGYYSFFWFDNLKMLRPNLFASLNKLGAVVNPYPIVD